MLEITSSWTSIWELLNRHHPEPTLVTFRVSRPKWILVGFGLGLRFLLSLSSPLFCVLDLQNNKRKQTPFVTTPKSEGISRRWGSTVTHTERERLRLSWRLRLGLGEPEELEEEEDRELEEPERLEPEELDPLEEPELEPELLLEVELDLDLWRRRSTSEKTRLKRITTVKENSGELTRHNGTTNLLVLLLLPEEALRRFRAFSRPRSFSPSLMLAFSLALSFDLSSSFLLVGDGAL